MSYSKNDLYGFYYDIESNNVLNDSECIVFIPTAAIKTELVFVTPVVKQTYPVVIKEKATTTSRPPTILRPPTIILRPPILHETPKPSFIENLTQNFMKITFCIFLTIILYK
jgi:hypothetical protein